MRTSAEKVGDNKVLLRIEVDGDFFAQAVNQAFRKVVKNVNVPGFRKGKVPRRLFEARFGREVLYKQAMEDILPDLYIKAVEAEGLEPIDRPKFDLPHIEEGKPVVFAAEVEVKPEPELGQYKGLEIEKPVIKVTEEDVERELEALRERHAELVSVDRDTVQKGDFVIIDFQGYQDGEPFEGGAAEGYQLEVGSNQFFPAFEEKLVGVKVGEETEIRIEMPKLPQGEQEDADGDTDTQESGPKQGPEKGEKDVSEILFKVTVHDIKVKEYPELDDEFARDVSEYETMEELRNGIRKQLEENAARISEQVIRDAAVDMVTDNATVKIPEVLVRRQIEHMKSELELGLLARGLRLKQYFEALDTTEEEWEANVYPRAERQVKAQLVLDAIAEAEGIETSDEEIDKKVDEYVQQSVDKEAARKHYSAETTRQWIAENLRREKVIDFVVENAVLKEVEWEEYRRRREQEQDASGEKDVSEERKSGRIIVASSMADVEKVAKAVDSFKEG